MLLSFSMAQLVSSKSATCSRWDLGIIYIILLLLSKGLISPGAKSTSPHNLMLPSIHSMESAMYEAFHAVPPRPFEEPSLQFVGENEGNVTPSAASCLQGDLLL